MNGPQTNSKPYKIAIVWRGDREARQAATPQNNRFHRVFEELAALGIHAEPAVYDDEFADEVREQLLAVDGVLVWVDPMHEGKTRTVLDPMLRDVASRGPWVSAHPDVILKMGVKEVLHRTKHLGWGTDTHLYRTAAEFRAAFPSRLAIGRPACPQAEPRQWRPGGLEGRTGFRAGRRGEHRARAACAPRQRARRIAAGGVHGALRALFRLRRLHRRSAVSAAPAGRHDPLLHGRGQGRRLRTSVHQGADPAAARRPGFAGGAARPAHHARR